MRVCGCVNVCLEFFIRVKTSHSTGVCGVCVCSFGSTFGSFKFIVLVVGGLFCIIRFNAIGNVSFCGFVLRHITPLINAYNELWNPAKSYD